MDLDLIKEQLGNFKTFVGAMNGVLENFPKSIANFFAVVGITEDGETYRVDLMKHNKEFGEELEGVQDLLKMGGRAKWEDWTSKSK